MKPWILLVLITLLAGLQYKLWLGQGGLVEQADLRRQIAQQAEVISDLQATNQALAAEVAALSSDAGLEEAARLRLGAKRTDEIYIRVAPETETASQGSEP